MGEWHLVDCIDPVSSDDEFPRTVIRNEQELRMELDRLQRRRPSIVQLRSPEGEILIIGIGGELSGLRWMKPPLHRHFKMAVRNELLSESGVNFRDQGADTGFRAKYLFRPIEIIEAVVEFFNKKELPDWIQWLEVNQPSKGNQLQ